MRTVILSVMFTFVAFSPLMAAEYTKADCSSAPDKQLCETQQKQFASDWKRANGGNYDAQRNVAYCLKNTCDGAIKEDKIDSCAWRMIIQAAKNNKIAADTWSYNSDCGSLENIERKSALAKAENTFRKIYKRALPVDTLLRR